MGNTLIRDLETEAYGLPEDHAPLERDRLMLKVGRILEKWQPWTAEGDSYFTYRRQQAFLEIKELDANLAKKVFE